MSWISVSSIYSTSDVDSSTLAWGGANKLPFWIVNAAPSSSRVLAVVVDVPVFVVPVSIDQG